MHNPYTCRLFRRIDYLIYKLCGCTPMWSEKTGHLIVGNGSAKTHFPGWAYVLAARVQNRWLWTRHVLNACLVLALLCPWAAFAQGAKRENPDAFAVIFLGQMADASQFGYKAPDGGLVLMGVAPVLSRLTITGEAVYEWAEKTFLDDGRNKAGSLGARLYVYETVFLYFEVSIVSHQNSQYVKTVTRGKVGVGARVWEFTGTLTFFGPAGDAFPDPNYMKGATLTVNHMRELASVGPVGIGVFTEGQVGTSTFTMTYDTNGDRFRGNIYRLRSGVVIRIGRK